MDISSSAPIAPLLSGASARQAETQQTAPAEPKPQPPAAPKAPAPSRTQAAPALQTQTTEAVPADESAGAAAIAEKRTVRNVEIDPQTQSVIFQLISESTGIVKSQLPSEAALKLREYAAAERAKAEKDSTGSSSAA